MLAIAEDKLALNPPKYLVHMHSQNWIHDSKHDSMAVKIGSIIQNLFHMPVKMDP